MLSKLKENTEMNYSYDEILIGETVIGQLQVDENSFNQLNEFIPLSLFEEMKNTNVSYLNNSNNNGLVVYSLKKCEGDLNEKSR